MEGGITGNLRAAQSLAVNLQACPVEREWTVLFPKSRQVSGQDKENDYIFFL
jgi:hypothetical protein